MVQNRQGMLPLSLAFVLFALAAGLQATAVMMSGSAILFTALGATVASFVLFTFAVTTHTLPRLTFAYVILSLTALITAAFAVAKGIFSEEIWEMETSTLMLSGSTLLAGLAAANLWMEGKQLQSASLQKNAQLLFMGVGCSFAALVGLMIYSQTNMGLVDPGVAIVLSTLSLTCAAFMANSPNASTMAANALTPQFMQELTEVLSERCAYHKIEFENFSQGTQHGRKTLEVNLIFPQNIGVEKMQKIADEIESLMNYRLGPRAKAVLHLISEKNPGKTPSTSETQAAWK